MRLRLALISVVLVASFGMAHADTISTFNLSGTLQDGSTSGTITIDRTSGTITSSNINVTTSQGPATFTGTPTSTTAGSSYDTAIFNTSSATGVYFYLVLPVTSLTNYMGGSLCTTNNLCSGYESGIHYGTQTDYVTAGTLSLQTTTVTPEPSSLLLLGTGVLVIGCLIRRKA